jgi:hypothetical protein
MVDTPLSIEDLIQNENAINREFDALQADWNAWQTQHSGMYGLYALWDKIHGGPDLTPFFVRADAIKTEIEGASITAAGKVRLMARYSQIRSSFVPAGNWKIILVGIGGLVAWKVALSGASAGASYAKQRAKRKLRSLGLMSPAEKKKRKKKR